MNDETAEILLIHNTYETSYPIMINADGQPCVWQLYRPNEYANQDPKDKNLYLWTRTCELFRTYEKMLEYFDVLGVTILSIELHAEFPDLMIIIDTRRFRWHACKAPIYG